MITNRIKLPSQLLLAPSLRILRYNGLNTNSSRISHSPLSKIWTFETVTFWVQMAKPIFLKIGESLANFTSRM